MQIDYASVCVFFGTGNWLPGELTTIGGVQVVVKPDGRVVSVQPNGDVSDRDPGTNGPWEAVTVDPTLNVLRYAGTGIPYALPYRGR